MSDDPRDEAGGAGAPADGTSEETGLSPVPEGGSEVERLRRECSELREQVLRKRAEFDNYRKRVERDRAQAGTEAAAAIFRALMPTLDNLDRALSATGGEGPLREGVELTRRDLLSLLESHGVAALDPKGQPFDPAVHQALAHDVAPGYEEGTIVEVFRKAYTFRDRLLRPALVKVAKAPEPADGEQSTGGSDTIH